MLWKIFPEEPLFIAEDKAGGKQGERSCEGAGFGAVWVQNSAPRADQVLPGKRGDLGGSAGMGEQQLSHPDPLPGKQDTWPKKNEVEAHFLVLSQTTRITKCACHCLFLFSMPGSFWTPS